MTNPIIAEFEEVTAEQTAIEKAAPVQNELGYVCTMNVETQDDALNLFEALSNAEQLDDVMGKVIHLENYVIQRVEVADQETGEIRQANRFVLMCEEGNYGTISSGVETAMRNLVTAMKNFPAPWKPGIALKPVKQQGRNGYKFTTLERVR